MSLDFFAGLITAFVSTALALWFFVRVMGTPLVGELLNFLYAPATSPDRTPKP